MHLLFLKCSSGQSSGRITHGGRYGILEFSCTGLDPSRKPRFSSDTWGSLKTHFLTMLGKEGIPTFHNEKTFCEFNWYQSYFLISSWQNTSQQLNVCVAGSQKWLNGLKRPFMGNEESSISEGQMQVWVGKAGGLCCFVFHYGNWLVFIMPRTMEASPGAKLAEL